ncbi:zinc transporter ZntB [Rhizorhapis sp. SPR117]|uniref:zinc transporter ZntB n=1 Tax=Rhizorhapis sp. SPR117 TaxID=2912611 RepID=UPI001F4228FE|nr:zinc transporter ZntB [Rhizorhapis sp. SPR117]
MIGGFIIHNGQPQRISEAQIQSPVGGHDFLWLHLDGRDENSRPLIEADAAIPLTARSALFAHETRPRCTVMDGGALINLRGLGSTPEDDPDPLVSIRIWAERGRVITVSFRSITAYRPVADRFLSGQILDPGDLIAAIADEITDSLDPDVASLGDRLDDIESKLDGNPPTSLRRQVAEIRSQAIGYRRFIAPQRQALDRISQTDLPWLDDVDHVHLREAADRCARMAEELEAVRERAALAHEELTDLRAEQLDRRSLLISIVALIFLPVTFVTGLLGMNVEGIPYAHEPWAFWGVIGFCALIAGAVGLWFASTRWVNR